MNTGVSTRTRGALQIVRQAEKTWNCSIVFYGETTKFNTVCLDTKGVISLLKVLGAPAPVSGKDRHVIEFYNTPRWNELKSLQFVPQAD